MHLNAPRDTQRYYPSVYRWCQTHTHTTSYPGMPLCTHICICAAHTLYKTAFCTTGRLHLLPSHLRMTEEGFSFYLQKTSGCDSLMNPTITMLINSTGGHLPCVLFSTAVEVIASHNASSLFRCTDARGVNGDLNNSPFINCDLTYLSLR